MPDTFVQTAYVVTQSALATGAGHTFSPRGEIEVEAHTST